MAFVLYCFALFGLVSDPTVHDLPDGTVKVATQVVVAPNNTRVTYDVGFNPKTHDQLLRIFEAEADKDGDKFEIFKKAFKLKIEDNLRVKADGKFVKATDIAYEPEQVGKHVQARFILNYEISVGKETRIEILDSCFQELDRVYNSGFKADHAVAIKESSTKAIPLRSRPTEKAAGETGPFMISGTVKWLKSNALPQSTSGFSPLIILFASLGVAGIVGLLLVPQTDSGADHDHH